MSNIKQGIMKRVFKLRTTVAVAALALLATGTFAQILTDYENVAETMYQTVGTTFRLYVEPDAVYSPTYNPATNANISPTAEWTWTYAGLTGAPLTGVATAQNWVEFTNPAAGAYTITVAESNTLGGCIDGTPVSQAVTVIGAPTAALTTADPAQACGDQVAMAVALTFTEAVPVAFAGYAFAVNELVENISPTSVVLATLTDNDGFIDFPLAGKLNSGNGLTGAASPYGYSFNTSALTVQNGLRTRYTYTLIKASDAPGASADGVISAISQKSNYIDGNDTYAFGDNQIVIIVNPAPTTGPIFHVPNDWAY
jgi:hypothetical protein